MDMESQIMRSVKFINAELEAVLGVFKTAFVFLPGDNVAIGDKIYVVSSTLKYVYLDAEEVEYIRISPVEDNK